MNIALNLNYDMIARDVESDTLKNMADMSYTKAYAGIEEITKKNIEDYNINLNMRYRASEKPSGGSDHAPFAEVGIPIFYFMAAMHPDYHQPSDELSDQEITNVIVRTTARPWRRPRPRACPPQYPRPPPHLSSPGQQPPPSCCASGASAGPPLLGARTPSRRISRGRSGRGS